MISAIKIEKATKESLPEALRVLLQQISINGSTCMLYSLWVNREVYHPGVNSYIDKPVGIVRFAEAIRQTGYCWLVLKKEQNKEDLH